MQQPDYQQEKNLFTLCYSACLPRSIKYRSSDFMASKLRKQPDGGLLDKLVFGVGGIFAPSLRKYKAPASSRIPRFESR